MPERLTYEGGSQWTVEQATELALEQFVYLLDGCDDEETVRPRMIFEALREVWSPNTEVDWDESITAGEVRERCAAARRKLAQGATPEELG